MLSLTQRNLLTSIEPQLDHMNWTVQAEVPCYLTICLQVLLLCICTFVDSYLIIIVTSSYFVFPSDPHATARLID